MNREPLILLQGDCLAVLKTLPDESVHCCVTSPPYYGLRDYGTAEWQGGSADCDHQQQQVRIRRNLAKAANDSDGGNRKAESRTDHDAITIPFRDICAKCGAKRIDAQIGLEQTPEEYVARLVAVFREVRRVLRSDGILWLNLGDSYASGKGTCNNPGGGSSSLGKGRKESGAHPLDRGNVSDLAKQGMKPKDLIGIPWMVAFALRADGWYLRQEIIWHKRAPMPESVTDRCTKAHEQIFMLTKSARYFCDMEAIKECSVEKNERRGDTHFVQNGLDDKPFLSCGGRNKRSVWTLSPSSYAEAHFATFPPELPCTCIMAGTSQRGACPKCGAPFERIMAAGMTEHDGETESIIPDGNTGKRMSLLRQAARERGEEYTNSKKTLGWRPTCSCRSLICVGDEPSAPHKRQSESPDAFLERIEAWKKEHAEWEAALAEWLPVYDELPTVPCVVIDPFNGSGTSGMVALELGRNYIGIDLNQKYLEMSQRRIAPALAAPILALA